MQRLNRHPSSPAGAVRVDAEAARIGPRLVLRYRLSGLAGAVLPLPAVSEQADDLWRHTCFEAFVAGPVGGYLEINLAPSTQWAAYRFDGYREGMSAADIPPPQFGERREGDILELEAVLELPIEGPWRVGLSAVIEHADGSFSYWALRHPPGKPDFHNADCFALELPESRGV